MPEAYKFTLSLSTQLSFPHCREVKLYKIPPRLASGHRSGDWQVGDNIFTGRLRLVAIGTLCKVILEESKCDHCPLLKRSLWFQPKRSAAM